MKISLYLPCFYISEDKDCIFGPIVCFVMVVMLFCWVKGGAKFVEVNDVNNFKNIIMRDILYIVNLKDAPI